MVFHVGITGFKIYAYNDTNKESSEIPLNGFDEKDLSKIESVYNKIKSILNGELGCACILMSLPCNDYRKKILEKGLECGFKKVQFIDHVSSIYFIAAFQSNCKPKNGDVIWIFNGDWCHVWKKENNTAKFFGETYQDFIEKSDLEKVMMETELNEFPDIVLYNIKFEKNFLEDFVPNAQLFSYSSKEITKGLFVKAQIMAGIPDVADLDANTILDNHFVFQIGENRHFLTKKNLPFSESINLNLKNEEKMLRIKYKRYTEYIELPTGVDFVLTIEIDINNIYTVNVEK